MLRAICAVAAAVMLSWTSVACAGSFPESLQEIGEEAFLGVPIEQMTLPDGLLRIGPHAFSTPTLRHVTLPSSVVWIDETAFDGTADGFFITVTKGSYAETWCKANGILYSYTDTLIITPAVTALSVSLQGEKYLGTPYSVMDCQAFVEACLKDAGLNMNLAGSNAWYRAMDWVGTPEECVALFGSIPKGAFLFILEFDGGEPHIYQDDGIGNASHIGIYTGRYDGGRTGAMASSKSKGGVIHSKFYGRTINGGWNRIGLFRKLDYGESVNLWLQTHCVP